MARRILPVGALVLCAVLFWPGIDIGYSRSDSQVSHGFWGEGPAATSPGAGRDPLVVEMTGGSLDMRRSAGLALMREADVLGLSKAGLQVLGANAREDPSRPLLVIEIDDDSLSYAILTARGSVCFQWRYASNGPLPVVRSMGGAVSFGPAPGSGDGEDDPVWQAAGSGTVEWRGRGLFTRGHAQARIAGEVCRAVFDVLCRCWSGAL